MVNDMYIRCSVCNRRVHSRFGDCFHCEMKKRFQAEKEQTMPKASYKFIRQHLDYLCEDVENLKDKGHLRVAIKSHLQMHCKRNEKTYDEQELMGIIDNYIKYDGFRQGGEDR